MADRSEGALVVCEFCAMIGAIFTIGVGAYVVFGLGHSGWWMLGFAALASCWSCKYLTEKDNG